MTLMALACTTGVFGEKPEADKGVEIRHLSNNTTMVRVTGDAKYLLLPIQESNNDAKISVSVANQPQTTFYARLAKNKVDYLVPFDLTPYENEALLLMVETEQSRSSVRDGAEDAVWGIYQYSRHLRHRQQRGLSTRFSPHTAIRMDERPQRHVL